jgi:hypothetical protein
VRSLATLVLIAATTGAAPPPEAIALPDGARGIGYDDIQYAEGLKRVLVPAGRTGRLVLIDPATKQLTSIADSARRHRSRGAMARARRPPPSSTPPPASSSRPIAAHGR